MATPCAQIFRTLYESNVFSAKPNQASFDKWKGEVLDALGTLNARLIHSDYICGPKMTIGDIIVFNELSQFMQMCDLTINSDELKNQEFLSKWFVNKMLVDPTIAKYDREMKEALSKAKRVTPADD